MSNPSAGACPMRRFAGLTSLLFLTLFTILSASAAPRKAHTVVLGAVRHVPSSKAGDPASAATGESVLDIRALIVDGVVKEWTTGEAHDVTDRSFVVRRAMRLNDALPGDQSAAAKGHWVWQRGPWLMVDRVTGRVAPRSAVLVEESDEETETAAPKTN